MGSFPTQKCKTFFYIKFKKLQGSFESVGRQERGGAREG